MHTSIIESTLNETIIEASALSGGCSYPAYLIKTQTQSLFLKTSSEPTPVFLREASGLKEMSKASIPCPEILKAAPEFLLLEYLPPEPPQPHFWENLATAVAKMHSTQHQEFGYQEDNFLGQTPQKNTVVVGASWGEFFWNQRILFQLDLNERHQGLTIQASDKEKLKNNILKSLSSYSSYSTTLHGDLWSGNIHCSQNQKAYLIDPAIYFGDREADIAYTKLFGGFHPSFYDHYNQKLPLEKGFEERKVIYNLYHLLNHHYLFGTSYKAGVERSIQSIISI